jgi:hypothetical protein
MHREQDYYHQLVENEIKYINPEHNNSTKQAPPAGIAKGLQNIYITYLSHRSRGAC